jgi:hypothetical protein
MAATIIIIATIITIIISCRLVVAKQCAGSNGGRLHALHRHMSASAKRMNQN